MFNLRLIKTSFALTALCAMTWLALPSLAQEKTKTTRDYSPSDATGEIIPKYKAAADANDYETALSIVDAQLSKTAADSYDAALLLQIKAQTLIQKTEYSKAIEPMEKALALSDAATPHFFEDRAVTNLAFFLAQLYYQDAAQSKDRTLTAASFDKAEKYAMRWKSLVEKPTIDNQLFFARLLYNKAAQDSDHADLKIMQQALDETNKGLLMTSRPKDDFYLLKFVCLQQMERYTESAEVLELLVKNKPEAASYWQQLASLYINTNQPTRAVLTFERAQSFGHMNSPKDNFNLVGILFNIAQYTKAAELLEAGLHDGRIEKSPDNWELLAGCYQEMQRPMKAIDALKEAAKEFPTSGQLDFMIAQAYQGLDLTANALKYAQSAEDKGNFTKSKPHQVYFFIAYMAYELKKYEVALKYAKKAAQFPEGLRDGTNMTTAVEAILREREAKKNKS